MKPQRKHIISEKYPVGAALLLALLSLLFEQLAAFVLSVTGLADSFPSDIARYLAVTIGALLFLIFLRLWYAPQYQGTMKSGLSAKETIFVTLPIIVYSLIVTAVGLVQYSFYFHPTFENVVMGLTGGFGEEVLFRVTVIPVCMGFLKSQNRGWLVPIVTALIFGAAHMGNVISGASLTNGIVQAVVTALMGFYYGALFVSTGSALPGILTHSVYDFLCFAGDPTLTSGIMTTTLAAWEIILNIVLALALAASGVVILKKIGSDRILAIWREKWSLESN
jgi:membrane protease YdiL (CAAX protease family)